MKLWNSLLQGDVEAESLYELKGRLDEFLEKISMWSH